MKKTSPKNKKRSGAKNLIAVGKKNKKDIKVKATPKRPLSVKAKAISKDSKKSKQKKGDDGLGEKLKAPLKPIRTAKTKTPDEAIESNLVDTILNDSEFDLEEGLEYEKLKNKSEEEIDELRALLGEPDVVDEVEISLRDAEGRLYCRTRDCDELAIVDGYCRLHYLKLWKRIQLKKKILTDGKLEKYIEELTQRYPNKYIEMIRSDLHSEKDFLSAIQELDIEDLGDDSDVEDDRTLLEEVRGVQSQSSSSDDDDSF